MKEFIALIDFKKTFLLLSFLLFSTLVFAQTEVMGIVVGEDGKPIEGANVLLKDSEDNTLAYSSTAVDGRFTIKISSGTYRLEVSHLGFRSVNNTLYVPTEDINLDTIIIHEDSSELEEVFIIAEERIVQKGDTTVFKTAEFLLGSERSLKDILETLPGMGVNEDGKVAIGGQEVDRLLIDGEDLYKNQHQFATENISSQMVGNIELIRNYTDFGTLKSENKSGLTALNVNIKNDFKDKLTGTVDAATGFESKYKIKPSVFSFGKKNKSSLITNFNNTGDSPISIRDYLELTNPVDTEKGSSSVNFSKSENMPQFLISEDKAKSRTINFATLSSIFNPNKNWKIDFYGIINHSRQERWFSRKQVLSTNTLPISIFDENRITEKSLLGIAHLKSIYKPKENSVLIFSSKLNTDLLNLDTDIVSITDQDSDLIAETFKPKKLISKTNISYSEKFNNSIITGMAFFNYDSNDDLLDINSDRSFLDFSFEDDQYRLSQKIRKEQIFSGLDIRYSFSKKKTTFSLRSNTSITDEKFDSSNNNRSLSDNHLSLNTVKSILAADFNYKFNKVFSSGIGLSYNYNLHKFNAESFELKFIDFKSNFKAEFNANNLGEFSYAFSHQTPTVENLIQHAIVINHRNIVANEDVDFLSYFPYHSFNYQHLIFNPKKKFSFIVNASHKQFETSISDNLINSEALSITKYKLVDRDKSTSLLVFFEKQFSFLPIAISNSTSLSTTNSEYFQDDIPTSFKTESIGGFVELSSKMKDFYLNFSIGYKYTFDRYTSGSLSTNGRREQPYLNLRGNILSGLYWELNNSYKLYSVDSNRKGIFYVDPSVRYSKEDSNWEYSLTGRNVLNLDTEVIIENNSFPGITEEQKTAILPGYILVGAKFKF